MKTFFILLTFLISTQLYGTLCPNWSDSKKIGTLNSNFIDEASGLIVSKISEDTLYHINDSGDGPYLYKTKKDGSKTRRIELNGFIPFDVEDLAYGKFRGVNTIFIGDIGDNYLVREDISIVLIKEKLYFSPIETPTKIIRARYPDGAHNAEGMAVHSNGDLYILTKEVDYNDRRALPANLYKISRDKLLTARSEIIDLEYVGGIELPYLLYEHNLWGRIVTSFDISPDGTKLLIMTYTALVEVNINLASQTLTPTKGWAEKIDYTIMKTKKMAQQEAAAYLPGGFGILYTTELRNGPNQPIYRLDCLGNL